MKNDVDFTKIMDQEKLIGVLNFNNMIPVNESCIEALNLKISTNDNISTKHYKKLAAKQLEWCRQNQESIVKKANKLYNMVQSGQSNVSLKKRCCNFQKLENILLKWEKENL